MLRKTFRLPGKAYTLASWSILSGSLVFWAAVATHPASALPACEQRKIIAQSVSASGKWLGQIFSNICGGAGFASTNATDTVELRSVYTQQPRIPEGTVFSMGYNEADEPILAIHWSGPNELEVTVPNAASPGTVLEVYKGVKITYEYVPIDDPVERLCIRNWQKSSLEDTIPDFVAKCRKSKSITGRG